MIENKFYVYKNQEIADEIENNQEFYDHLTRIRDLDEILSIYIFDENLIAFKKNPSLGGPIAITIIDEHWVLQVIPNT